MGLIVDSSLPIADERGKFDMAGFLRQFSGLQPVIAAITASELLHGVERAQEPARKARRQRHVEQILAALAVHPPRVSLDAPRVQPFVAGSGLPVILNLFASVAVFREGAEHGTRGACAPLFSSMGAIQVFDGDQSPA